MGWLDLIGLAVDVKQSYDLHQAHDQLRRIETGALQEAYRNQVLEVLRNFVFASLQQMKVLEEHADASPQPVYVAAKALESRFKENGITPEIFPEFMDKEYVQQVQQRLSVIIQHSQSTLASAQITRGEECGKAIVEMPLLDRAIEGRESREQLEAMDAEWQRVSGMKNMLTVLGLMLVGAGLVSPVCICCSLQYLFPSHGDLLCWGTAAIGGTVALVSIAGGMTAFVKGNSSRYRELDNAREECIKKIPDAGTWEEVKNLFGNRSTSEYQDLRATRESLIREVMGQVEGYDRLLRSSSKP